MKILILILLSIIPVAHAADALFLRVLSRLNNDGVLPQKTLACQAGGENAELVRTCAIQLCGDSQSAPTAYITEARIEEWTQPEVMARFSEIEDVTKQLIDHGITQTQKVLAALQERLKKGKFTLDPGTTTDATYENLASTWYGSFVSANVDHEKPLEERLTFEISDTDFTKDEKAGLVVYAEGMKEAALKNFGDGCYAELYTAEEAATEIKARFQQFDDRMQAAITADPAFMQEHREGIESLRKQITVDPIASSFDVGNLYNMLKYWDIVTAQKLSQAPLWNEPAVLKCATAECRKGIQSLVANKDWTKLAKDVQAKLANPKLREEQLFYCRSSFAGMSLKASETERILEALPRVKASFMERVAKNFSPHSRESFANYMNKTLNFAFGADGDSSIDTYIEYVKQNQQAAAYEVPLATPGDVVSELLKIQHPLMGGVNVSGYGNCSGTGVTAWDAFIPVQPGAEDWLPSDGDPTKDNILISHFSCTHPAQGEQVLAHELGHALSQAFADKELSESSFVEFMRGRACAKSWSGETDLPSGSTFLSHEGDRSRTEEDNADLLAYIYAYDNPALMSCALLEPEIGGPGYVGASIANPIVLDSHSSPLTRAIREALHKRLPLPAACQQLIGPGSGMRFNTCF